MLKAIKNALFGFIDMVTGLVGLVVGFFEDIAYVVKLCGTFVAKIPTFFSWLPSEALALIVTIFGIVVIYKVLGREG